jgi:hypothetical protein
MRAAGCQSFIAVLPAGRCTAGGFGDHAIPGRTVPQDAVLRIAQNDAGAASAGLHRHQKAGAAPDASHGVTSDLPEAQDQHRKLRA